MASNWYFARQGQQFGPVSSGQLREMARTRQVLPTDLIWKQGMDKWVAAASIQDLFQQGMPPLPQAIGSAQIQPVPPYYPPQHVAPRDSIGQPPPAVGETLGIICLLIPLAGAMLNYFWIGSMNLLQGPGSSLSMIIVLTVISTGILIGVEANQLGIGGPNDPRVQKGQSVTGPVGWAVLTILFWIVGFPAYMYYRSQYGLKNMLAGAICTAALFLGSAHMINSAIEAKQDEISASFDELVGACAS